MKHLLTLFFALILIILPITQLLSNNLTEDFVVGDPGIQSLNAIAFGPQGILFIGDSKTASVIAIETKDIITPDKTPEINMTKVDDQIATTLGTTVDQINIIDMAVNPFSKAIYFAVHHANGTPVLLKTTGEGFIHIPLEKVSHAKIGLTNPVAADAKDKRGRELRKWAISDLSFYDGNVMVTGLSNEEFSSTFRSIAFPFKNDQSYASLEIYHAAHGRYETYSPIKTFLPFELNGKAHLIASYTCTPLVVFPMDKLKKGAHNKGKTVAELGNWNTPLDIISMEKEGEHYILMANSARAVMKMKVSDIENHKDFLTEKVEERSGTAGIDFINLPFVNVLQLDKLDEKTFLMLQRKADGDLVLITQSERWL